MALVCKAACGKKLNISYHCVSCAGTFHKGCGKLRTFLDETDDYVRLCGECQLLPTNSCKYKPSVVAGKQSKKRKIESSRTEGNLSSTSSDDSEDQQQSDTETVVEPTLTDVLKAINSHKKSNQKSFKEMNVKIDANTGTLEEFKSSRDQQQNDIVTLFSEVSCIKTSLSNEFSISGHLGALNSNANLSDIVIGVVNYMGVPITAKHIRGIRLMKNKVQNKPFSQVVASPPEPPRIIVKMYSNSKVLRILDARKTHTKILNSQVTPGCESNKQIFVNQMLSKEVYELQKTCKTWAKANGFKYVWYSEGNILIKKANGDKTFIIHKPQDLQNIPLSQNADNPTTPSTSQYSQASQPTSKNQIIQPPILNLSDNK